MHVDSVPYPELSQPPAIHTKICAKLFREHREVRELQLKAGATLKGLEKGKANLEASLAYLRRELQEPECIHCSKKNSGPFRRCIVVKGLFGGSCTNCRYNEDQARCSLRDRSKKKLPKIPRRETRLMRYLNDDAGISQESSTFEKLVQEPSRMTYKERLKERQKLILQLRALPEADALACGMVNDE